MKRLFILQKVHKIQVFIILTKVTPPPPYRADIIYELRTEHFTEQPLNISEEYSNPNMETVSLFCGTD